MFRVDKNPNTGRAVSEPKVLNLADLMGKGTDDEFIITENNLYLEGEINPDSAKEIVTYIIEANSPPPDGMQPLKHINLFINSGGGCMASSFSVISAISASEIPIRTISMGDCASGGLMIAISGHVRLVDKYCSVMSHTLSTSYSAYAKHAELENWVNSVKAETEKIVSLYEERTNLSRADIETYLLPKYTDVFLSAEQAIEFGLFDNYFTNFKDLN